MLYSSCSSKCSISTNYQMLFQFQSKFTKSKKQKKVHTWSCNALNSVLLQLRRRPLLPLIQPLPPSTLLCQISSEYRQPDHSSTQSPDIAVHNFLYVNYKAPSQSIVNAEGLFSPVGRSRVWPPKLTSAYEMAYYKTNQSVYEMAYCKTNQTIWVLKMWGKFWDKGL